MCHVMYFINCLLSQFDLSQFDLSQFDLSQFDYFQFVLHSIFFFSAPHWALNFIT